LNNQILQQNEYKVSFNIQVEELEEVIEYRELLAAGASRELLKRLFPDTKDVDVKRGRQALGLRMSPSATHDYPEATKAKIRRAALTLVKEFPNMPVSVIFLSVSRESKHCLYGLEKSVLHGLFNVIFRNRPLHSGQISSNQAAAEEA
jgi:hypothetical protein